MKKQYLKFGIVYCVLVLLIFATAMTLFTRKKVSEVKDNKRLHYLDMPSYSETYQLDYLINKTYRSMASDTPFLTDDMGAYYVIVDCQNDYSKILESANFLKIGGQYDDVYIPIDSSFPYKNSDFEKYTGNFGKAGNHYVEFRNVEITGAKCDHNIIYDGTISWTDAFDNSYSYSIGHPEYVNEAESVDFEQWVEEQMYYSGATLYLFDDSFSKRQLNEKAEKLADEYVEKYKAGDVQPDKIIKEEGFFTAKYVVVEVNADNKISVETLVIKPFRMALRENKSVYILSFVALIISELAIALSIRALYRNQKSFEIRSQKLTRGIAHELKTPLAITKACVENWEYIDDEQRKEYSEKVIKEVDHMSGMITNLLELSKLSGGNVKLNKEDVDLMALTKNIYSRMSDLARERDLNVTITGDRGDGVYPVYADLDMMNIVISNYLSNAIKYCDRSIKVMIAHDGRKIELSVTNDGARISKQDQGKVWDVFYKTDESRTDRLGSSGVGLSVVKNILDMHKAKYGCYDNSAGMVFWFSMDEYNK